MTAAQTTALAALTAAIRPTPGPSEKPPTPAAMPAALADLNAAKYAAKYAHGLALAVIAYTQGRISPNELWAELDYAATAYEAAGDTAAAAATRARYAELTR